MGDFERHIMENREAMDIYTPAPDVWTRIEGKLGPKHWRRHSYLWRAAIIIIASGAALSVIAGTLSARERNRHGETMSVVRDTEQYYNNQFYSIYNRAIPMLTSNPEVNNELNTSMAELDSISTEIKRDLKDNAANSEVVEALICNYRLRIELLENMLSMMKEEELKNEKPAGHEI